METKKYNKSINKYACLFCDYNTSILQNYNKHILTLKHKINTNNDTLEINGNEKVSTKYFCSYCNYNTIIKSNYDKHLLTEKHISNLSGEYKNNKHICSQCNKEYSNNSGLWKHKKVCIALTPTKQPQKDNTELNTLHNTLTPSNIITPELVFDIIKQSKELQDVLIEQNKELQNKLLEQNVEHHKEIVELTKKQTTNINTQNNITNQQFNLQFFLNETCKDAMNLVDFVNSLKLTPEDFETTGRLGFVDGISRIFIKELKKLNTEKLPIHCTDLKRETVYIKNNNIWEKENDEKHRLKWTIDRIADLNLNQHHEWQAKYPQCRENNTPENHKFVELTSVALGGRGKEQEDKFREKIMRNVLKEVVLDKKSNVLK
jgi:hypothetical protein